MFGKRILANFKEAPGMATTILSRCVLKGGIDKILGTSVINVGDELEISFKYLSKKETCIFYL